MNQQLVVVIIVVSYPLYNGIMQETLLNLLLRNYLHYNLYDQAEKLRSKAPRFEAHSNQQATPICILFHFWAHQSVWNMFNFSEDMCGNVTTTQVEIYFLRWVQTSEAQSITDS